MNIAAGIFYKTDRHISKNMYKQYPFADIADRLFCSSHTCFFSSSAITRAEIPGKGLFLVGDISLYNTKQLKAKLDIAYSENDPGVLLLEAYRKWGNECVSQLEGDFMGAIWDEKDKKLLCFRDQLGKVPFYYYHDKDVFIFSNKIQFLANYKLAADINNSWIERFITQSNTPADKEETPYQYIKKMPPGNIMTVMGGELTGNYYWHLTNNKQQTPDNVDEAVKILTSYLENIIDDMMPGDTGNAGVELSGGLDSSAITAFTQKNNGDKLFTFSNILPSEYKNRYNNFTDEFDNIEVVRKYLELNNHTYVNEIADDPLRHLDLALTAVGYPTYMNINISQQGLYQKVKESGLSILFSGFGGDEMLSTNLYNLHLKKMIRKGQFAGASKMIRAHGYSFIKSYISVYYKFLLSQFQLNQQRASKRSLIVSSVLKDNYKHTPQKLPALSNENYISEWHIYTTTSPELIERLETGYHITQEYNLKYRYPLLHHSLLEYFYTLPDAWKLDHKFGRALFRKMLKGKLPDEVVESRKPVNTAVIPVLKIEIEKYFYKVKDLLLSLPKDHVIFDYVDREKLFKVVLEQETAFRMYEMLKRLITLSMFFDRQSNRQLYDIG